MTAAGATVVACALALGVDLRFPFPAAAGGGRCRNAISARPALHGASNGNHNLPCSLNWTGSGHKIDAAE